MMLNECYAECRKLLSNGVVMRLCETLLKVVS